MTSRNKHLRKLKLPPRQAINFFGKSSEMNSIERLQGEIETLKNKIKVLDNDEAKNNMRLHERINEVTEVLSKHAKVINEMQEYLKEIVKIVVKK